METAFIPPRLGEKQWRELQASGPAEVCRRAAVRFEAAKCYVVPFLEQEFRVYPDAEQIAGPAGETLPEDPEFTLLLLAYLLSAQNVPLTGKWISEKDFQGGSLFFKGPHALPVKPLIAHFGNAPEQFLAAGKALGGQRITDYGDAALEFQALPRIPVRCVLWAADDEFPARVTFLFDASLAAHFPLDVVLASVHCVTKHLIDAAQPARENSGQSA